MKPPKLYAGVMAVEKNKLAKDGRTFHVLTISDSKSTAKLYYWDDDCPFQPEEFIAFDAEVVQGQPSFFSSKIGQVALIRREELPVDATAREVMFCYTVDTVELSENARAFIDAKVRNVVWKSILYSVTDVEFLNKVIDVPAGKSAHHSLKGGLLQHIKEMFEFYRALSETDRCKELHHEYIILGIFLHDYYKFKEYTIDESGFTLTNNASLLGHIFQGAQLAQRIIAKAEVNNNQKLEQLDKDMAVHTLLAHHGELEWGSPVKPAIPEAITLHYIDQLSAKLNMFRFSNNLEYNKFLGVYPVKE